MAQIFTQKKKRIHRLNERFLYNACYNATLSYNFSNRKVKYNV